MLYFSFNRHGSQLWVQNYLNYSKLSKFHLHIVIYLFSYVQLIIRSNNKLLNFSQRFTLSIVYSR